MAGSVIYHGPMGEAGYQAIVNRMLPLRGLEKNFNTLKSRLALAAIRFLQPRIRAWARNHVLCVRAGWPRPTTPFSLSEEFFIDSPDGSDREYFLGLLLAKRWHPCGGTELWDLQFHGTRVLMATERGGGTARRTLVRVWGSEPARIARILGEKIVS